MNELQTKAYYACFPKCRLSKLILVTVCKKLTDEQCERILDIPDSADAGNQMIYILNETRTPTTEEPNGE